MTIPSRIIVAGLILSSIALATPTLAQSRTRRSRVKFTMPRLSYDRGAPGKRGDGASRGVFCQSSTNPIALTPQYSEPILDADGNPRIDSSGNPLQRHFVLTQTSEPQPTFALHLPLGKEDVQDLQLTLFVGDTAGNALYELPISAPDQAGIISFKPSSSEPSLKAGQRYNWEILVEAQCNINGVKENEFLALTGQIERQQMAAENSVIGTEEYAIIAANQGFWSDAMSAVADLHRQDRSNEQYLSDWATLLEAIGLEQLTAAPLSEKTQLLSLRSQTETSSSITTPMSKVHSRLFPVR